MEKRNIIRNQKGFTLIEIIAVLVILGILAAVAVPKYLDMANNARTRAVEGALAAAASDVMLRYSNNLLVSGVHATALGAAVSATAINLGDYSYTSAAVTNTVTVTITAGDTTGVNTNDLKKAFDLGN